VEDDGEVRHLLELAICRAMAFAKSLGLGFESVAAGLSAEIQQAPSVQCLRKVRGVSLEDAPA